MFLHKNNSNFYYYCKLCNKFSETLQVFQIHLKSTHRINDLTKPLQCPMDSCNVRFEIKEKKNLQIHVKTEHMGYCFKCKACDEVFLEQKDREYHEKRTCPIRMALLTNFPPEDEMTIPKGEKAFWLFSRYLKMKTPGAKTFFCKLCDERQVHLESINDHFNEKHDCDSNSSYRQCLCPIEGCSARFMCRNSRERDLIWHLENAHLTSVCKICRNRFTDDIFKILHEHKYHGLKNERLRNILAEMEEGKYKYGLKNFWKVLICPFGSRTFFRKSQKNCLYRFIIKINQNYRQTHKMDYMLFASVIIRMNYMMNDRYIGSFLNRNQRQAR